MSTILGYVTTPRTIREIADEVLGILSETRRLQRRGFTSEETTRIMCRRVDRYFRNGRFVPLAKRAAN